jgi:hypothetical protein
LPLAAQQWDNPVSFPADIQFTEGSSMILLRSDAPARIPLFLLLSTLAAATAGLQGCVKTETQLNPPAAPSIISADGTTATEGIAGSFPVTVTGTPPPTITVSGVLPGGVTFSAGILSGTPTETGTFPLVFTAKNGVLPNAVQNFTLMVNPAE